MTSTLLSRTNINISRLSIDSISSKSHRILNTSNKCIICNRNQQRLFSDLPYSSDATVSYPGYTRPATADMRSQRPLRSMTNEDKLNWSKQNKEFRHVYIYFKYVL